MDENINTEAGVIADLTRLSMTPHLVRLEDGRQFVALPEGVELKEVTNPHGLVLPPPGRLVQNVKVQTVDSLVEYVNRFKTPATVLLADIATSTIVGLLDYHAAGDVGVGDHKAAHVGHRVSMVLPYSVEWGIWTKAHGQYQGQEVFAQFLEENSPDVVAPTGAELIEVARDFRSLRSADFRKAIRTNGDLERFEYSESETASSGSGVEVPSKFELGIPVYFGEPPVQLFAFLRWKKADLALLLGISLNRAEQVRQAVFKQIVLDAGYRCDCPVMFGTLC